MATTLTARAGENALDLLLLQQVDSFDFVVLPDAQVQLRGLDAGVAEQFHDDTRCHATQHQLRREIMSQVVHRNVFEVSHGPQPQSPVSRPDPCFFLRDISIPPPEDILCLRNLL